MRVLLDTNVLLDVLLNRQPWSVDASAVWTLNDEHKIHGFVAASTFTDIYYIARRIKDSTTALRAIQVCLTAFDICAVDKSTIMQAYSLSGNDFEDNVLIACAGLSGMDAIVTRNPTDFQHALIPIYTPNAFLQLLTEDEDE